MSEPEGFRRLSPLTPVVRAPIVTVAVVGGSWQTLLQRGSVGVTALVVLGLLVVGAVYGVASWVRTKYWIDGGELRIDTGVVSRQSRRIRIDRLQGIDIVQPLLARAFGLAELRFDVASGSDREGKLAFLPHPEALALRTTLLERRDQLTGDDATAQAPASPERLLARLDPGLLVASLVLSPETLVLGAAAAALTVSFGVTGSFALAGGLVPTVLALGLTVASKLTSYWGFTLADSEAGLHVRRGLTSLSSQTIALHRVQGVVVSEPLLWRRLGWARLDVSVAGYKILEADKAQASSVLMPVASRAEVDRLVTHVLGYDVAAVPLTPSPRRARWLAPLSAWTLAFGQDERLVVSRRGFLRRRLSAVPQARVQSVRLTRGPLQRLLRLADVHADSPPGPVTVRGHHLDPRAARTAVEAAVRNGRRARQSRSSGPASTSPTVETTQ